MKLLLSSLSWFSFRDLLDHPGTRERRVPPDPPGLRVCEGTPDHRYVSRAARNNLLFIRHVLVVLLG